MRSQTGFSKAGAPLQAQSSLVSAYGAMPPEDNGSRVLNDFQAFLQEFGVSMPELDIYDYIALQHEETNPNNPRAWNPDAILRL